MPSGPNPRGHRLSAWLFLRGLGLVYLIAFVSFGTQARGLVGPEGILPLAPYLRAVAAQVPDAHRALPTLSWLNPDDPPLLCLAVLGSALSVCLMLGLAPLPCLALLWLLYLSLVNDGQIFMGYQWDSLLLEAGLAALALAPWTWRSSLARDPEPPRAGRWLLYWLLFRLLFGSGWVKFSSGDAHWRDLSALSYHWWTQPLPLWTSWYLNQLPFRLQRVACFGVFAVELGAPFLIFIPAARKTAFLAVTGLMALIAATGNYCFFNLLTVVLASLLLGDGDWPGPWRARLQRHPRPAPRGRAASLAPAVLAAFLAALSLPLFLGQLGVAPAWPSALIQAENALAPLRSVNDYGLFAVMTTLRHEIVLEGSDDGRTWKEYGLPWKPGDINRRPGLVAPFQPRLDWQLWFAALGSRQDNPWFEGLCGRILSGSPAVLGLFADNPFPARPPRFLRARLYDYRFTGAAARRTSGAWWRRTLIGDY